MSKNEIKAPDSSDATCDKRTITGTNKVIESILKRALDVFVTNPEDFVALNGSAINEYNTVSSVAASSVTNVITYTVPVGFNFYFSRAQVSGNNKAVFEVLIDGQVEAKKRTYFTHYNESFAFDLLKLSAGQVIIVRVTHNRPMVGDFEARIVGYLIESA